MPRKKRLTAKYVKEEAQHYRTTIIALYIFADLLKQNNPSAQFSFGRKMTTSENNTISKKNDQTPDLVVQVSDKEGYVCEAKATMSNNDDSWEDHIRQLQKYDDDLEGWWTNDQKLKTDSNTVLLVDSEKSIKFKKLVETKINKKELAFKKPIGFVGFVQESGAEESLLFSLDWGRIYNTDLHSILEDRKRVPLEDYVAKHDGMKFNDTPPPVEHTMEILWTHLFNGMATGVEYDPNSKSRPIPINIQTITTELQKAYGQQSSGEREVCFPQTKWIRTALEHFEVIGLAKKKDVDNFVINYKQLRGDLLDKFFSSRNKMDEKNKKKGQGDLFLVSANMEKKRLRESREEAPVGPLTAKEST